MKKSEVLAQFQAIKDVAPFDADPRVSVAKLAALLHDLYAASDEEWTPEADEAAKG
jgi:HD superfamily phosphodiesterase